MARTKAPKIVTPKGVAVWPHLTKPDEYEGKKHFKTRIAFDPADPEVVAYVEKVTEAAEAAHAAYMDELRAEEATAKGKKLLGIRNALENCKLHVPFEDELDDDAEKTGRILLSVKKLAAGVKDDKAWSTKLPLWDSQNKAIHPSDIDIWGGSIIRAEHELFPFGMNAGDNVSAGISPRLVAIQVIELRTGDGGSSGFGVEEDGYAGEESAPNNFNKDEEDDDPDF